MLSSSTNDEKHLKLGKKVPFQPRKWTLWKYLFKCDYLLYLYSSLLFKLESFHLKICKFRTGVFFAIWAKMLHTCIKTNGCGELYYPLRIIQAITINVTLTRCIWFLYSCSWHLGGTVKIVIFRKQDVGICNMLDFMLWS